MIFPKTVPSRSMSAFYHCTTEIAAARGMAPCACAIAAGKASGNAPHSWSAYKDMTMLTDTRRLP